MMPNIGFQPGPEIAIGTKGETLLRGNFGTKGMKEHVNIIKGSGEVRQLVPNVHEEQIISQHPEIHSGMFDFDKLREGSQHEANEHHREGASLGNGTPLLVWLPKTSRNGVIDREVFLKVTVSSNNAVGHAPEQEHAVQSVPGQLVEAFSNVSHGTRASLVMQSCMLGKHSSFV